VVAVHFMQRFVVGVVANVCPEALPQSQSIAQAWVLHDCREIGFSVGSQKLVSTSVVPSFIQLTIRVSTHPQQASEQVPQSLVLQT
jgi:hypothetical protein